MGEYVVDRAGMHAALARRARLAHIPHPHDSILTAGEQQRCATAAASPNSAAVTPSGREGRGVTLMRPEGRGVARVRVPAHDGAVAIGGGEHAARPRHVHDRGTVCAQFEQLLAARGGPEAQRLVVAGGEGEGAVGGAKDLRDRPRVPQQVDTLGRARRVPQAHLGVHPGREDAPVRQVRHVSNPLGVAIALCVEGAARAEGRTRVAPAALELHLDQAVVGRAHHRQVTVHAHAQ